MRVQQVREQSREIKSENTEYLKQRRGSQCQGTALKMSEGENQQDWFE